MRRLTVSTMALLAALSLPGAAIAQTSNDQQVVQSTDKGDATKAPDGMIVLQDDNAFLVSDLTGATVYSPKDEAIGDVNDVIVTRDGKVDGLVIGVGGFLGIGEKNVAIEMSKLKLVDTENGIKLVLDMSKDELAAAPEFKSKAEMEAEMRATQPSSTQGLMVPDQTQLPTQTQESQPQQ